MSNDENYWKDRFEQTKVNMLKELRSTVGFLCLLAAFVVFILSVSDCVNSKNQREHELEMEQIPVNAALAKQKEEDRMEHLRLCPCAAGLKTP